MIPLTGPITIGTVAAELSISLPLSLGDSRVRALAEKPTGPISLGDVRGKSAYTPPTIVCEAAAFGSTFGTPGTIIGASAGMDFEILGGEAPFVVTWSMISGDDAISVQTPNPPTFYAIAMANWTFAAVFRATVTDNRSNTSPPVDVEVQLSGGDV